ncbi:60S ribosomal protein L23-like [Melanaphis sacchari]|uniref:60S ribosomal protein L23-like n=1 Tax=Melanaphis sacchari TaxID=742174 RepID=UPI000DC13256|nr:60S ribosomal protein L23-like [Melanaphis sacchari]
MTKEGRDCYPGVKFRISLDLPVGAVINCVHRSGTKELFIIAIQDAKGQLNRLPDASLGNMIVGTVEEKNSELRKKIMAAVIIPQQGPFLRKKGIYLYFDDDAGIIIYKKGELKGCTITGPLARECAALWPRIASYARIIA